MLDKNNSTIILAGSSFNVSIFQQNWLLSNDILTLDDFGGENFFTPIAVNISNTLFSFLVLPERIQCTIKGNAPNAEDTLKRIVQGIASKLEHTPVTAIGINFDYCAYPENPEQFHEITRELLLNTQNPLTEFFSGSDSRYGAYFSTNLDQFGVRLKLDIKPLKNEEGPEMLHLNFNCHKDLESMSDVIDLVDSWKDIDKEVNKIAKRFEQKLG
jgi:hypothetical protein